MLPRDLPLQSASSSPGTLATTSLASLTTATAESMTGLAPSQTPFLRQRRQPNDSGTRSTSCSQTSSGERVTSGQTRSRERSSSAFQHIPSSMPRRAPRATGSPQPQLVQHSTGFKPLTYSARLASGVDATVNGSARRSSSYWTISSTISAPALDLRTPTCRGGSWARERPGHRLDIGSDLPGRLSLFVVGCQRFSTAGSRGPPTFHGLGTELRRPYRRGGDGADWDRAPGRRALAAGTAPSLHERRRQQSPGNRALQVGRGAPTDLFRWPS